MACNLRGLAGIPYDDSYAVAAAAAVPAVETVQLAPPTDESEQGGGESILANAQEDDVSQVLNGMFNLFEAEKPKPKKVKQQALVLPKANTRAASDAGDESSAGRKRSFFDKIFGGIDDEPKKKKKKKDKKKDKKKTLLDLY